MRTTVAVLVLAGVLVAPALAQDSQPTLRDLEGKSLRKLGKDEVTQLLTGSQMSRISGRGNRNIWTNEKDGAFVASSENTQGVVGGRSGTPTTARGKWHISDDGRYCVLIEWRNLPTEEWCRYVFETSEGHYMARSDSVGSERVFKFEIKK
jgi:hypothetical protein